MSTTGDAGPCAVCGAGSALECSRCLDVFYCGAEHQRLHGLHWPRHRDACAPRCEVVCADGVQGNHLVSTRAIRQGQLILKEKALVMIPYYKPVTDELKSVSCANCCQRMSLSVYPATTLVLCDCLPALCSECGVPLCSELCKQTTGAATSLHTDAECAIMRRAGVRFTLPVNERLIALGPLRVLMLTGAKAKLVRTLNLAVKDSQEECAKASVEMMMRTFGTLFKEEDVRFAKRISLSNMSVHEVKEHRTKAGVLHGKADLTLESCVPNGRFVCLSKHKTDFTFGILAKVDIPAGSVITATHIDLLQPTLMRRAEMLKMNVLMCECERCKDPNEMGLRFASFCCRRCKKRRNPMSVLELTGLGGNDYGLCKWCGLRVNFNESLLRLMEPIANDLKKVNQDDPRQLNALLRRLEYPRGDFHSTSSLIICFKQNLIRAYGKAEGFSYEELTDEQLNQKMRLFKDLEEVVKVLSPGPSDERGVIVKHALKTLFEIGRRRVAARSGNIQEIITKAENLLAEYQIIRVEPFLQPKVDKLRKELLDIKASVKQRK